MQFKAKQFGLVTRFHLRVLFIFGLKYWFGVWRVEIVCAKPLFNKEPVGSYDMNANEMDGRTEWVDIPMMPGI